MGLASTGEIMAAAVAGNYGQGAFNVIHLETAEALVAGAEDASRPVILQLSQNCIAYHGGLEPISKACLALAESAKVPVALHLDHAEDVDLALRAIDLGFGSVMYDGAHLPYTENVATTAKVRDYAHANDVWIEAELGEVGGKDGAHAPGVLTRVDEALSFVAETGVDALAVAVGSSHAMTERVAELNFERIAELKAALNVPLVLHGSSGVSDASLQRAVVAGMRKINISTHLNSVFTGAVRNYLSENPQVVDSRKYVAAGRKALVPETARLLNLLAEA